jgi:RHS repeat-associated protein
VRFWHFSLLLFIVLAALNLHAATPQIASVSPQSGPVGTQVQINGSGFGASQGSSVVAFATPQSGGGAPVYNSAAVVSWSDTQIVAVVPAAMTSGPVKVTVGGVDSNTNVYFSVPPPRVTSIMPASGGAGTQVTVIGGGFQATQGSSYLLFFNNANNYTYTATVSSWSDSKIVASVPAGAITGPVEVVVNGQASNLDVLFTMPNPVVTSVSPAAAPVGTQIQINGSGFGSSVGSSPGASTVTINNKPQTVVSWSDKQIVVTVASVTTSGPIAVTVGGVTSNISVYFTVPPPQVTSITPASGAAGMQVTISGSGFQATQGSSTIIVGTQQPAISSWSDTQIVAKIASGTGTGPVNVNVNGVGSNQDVVFMAPNPIVTSVSPSSGPGGSQVTINGTGFGATQGSSSVSLLGSTAAASIVSWSNTQIVATVSPYADTYGVQVTVSGVGSNTDNVFTVARPQITSISPTSGPVGTQVTITGSNFQATQSSYASVRIGSGSLSPISSWSNTQIVGTVSSGASTGPVSVQTYIYANDLISNQNVIFTMPNPIVASVSPSSGPGGTQVQINGSGFGATQGSSTIAFNGVNATVASWSDTQITAAVPVTATSGAVTVSEGGITSSGVNFTVPAPQITSISPTSGAVGTQVTINGANFQTAKPSNGSVTFNGYSGTVASWNNTQIVANVPSGAITGPVAVSIGSLSSNLDVRFTMPNPVITGLSPAYGPVGTQFQINGSGFGATQGTSTVVINNSTALPVTSWSDSQIVVTVPSGAVSGPIQVSEGGVASNSNISFAVASLEITSVSPPAGAVGTQVTVNGSGFGATQGTSTLAFNGTTATSISSWTDAQIVATVPSGTSSGAVKVVSGSVSSNTNVRFTITGVVVTSVSPSSGPAGTQIQINGSGFGATQGSSTVQILYPGITYYSASVVSWSGTQITAAVPTTSYTNGYVVVTVGGVQSNTDQPFTTTTPVVSSVSPSSGPVGTQVTINGSNFGASQNATQGASTVVFNNATVAQSGISSWSNTQIVATVPSAATTGAVKVTVGGVSSYSNTQFTVPPPQVTSVAPASGVVGTQVTINGSGFQSTQPSGAYLYFACTTYPGSCAASIVSWSNTQIVATVPANAITGGVRAYVNVSSNNDVLFSMPNPVVTSVSPTTGPVGTQVTINGTGFGASQGTVAFSTNNSYVNAAVTSWSDTQIVATVPAAATAGPVQVSSGGVNSNSNVFYAVPGPHITGISPSVGGVGTQVTITGSGFQATQGGSYIQFYNGNSTVNSWSDTQIVATVGSQVTTGPVKVNVNSVISNQDVQFTVPNPVITSISPASAPVGTQVTVTGVGFGTTQGASTVTFNSLNYGAVAATISSWSDTQIVATVPPTAASGSVKVTEGGVPSNTNINFTVPAPQITSISPASGSVGTQVTINGSGFQSAQGSGYVTFYNGVTAAITSWSDTQIVATAPASATTGGLTVQANNAVNSNRNIVFTLPNPVIAGLQPAVGPVGTQVLITGSGFGASQNANQGTSTVTFGPSNVPGTVLSWSDTQVVVLVPNAATTGRVRVNEGGVSSASNVDFTVPAPLLSSITPMPAGVGNTVTITGSGFQAAELVPGGNQSTVNFTGGFTPASSWSDTQIVTKVPSGASNGPVTIMVNGVASNPLNFTIPNNRVSSVSPSSGAVGTQVTVAGVGFGAAQGSSTISFSGQAAASITGWSDTQIMATVPQTAAAGPVAVTVNTIPSNLDVIFTVPGPRIDSVAPWGGIAGTAVTIKGAYFTANQTNNTVSFNGVAASVSSWSDTQIAATVPSGVATGPLQVSVNGVNANSGYPFYVPNPVITSVTPPEAPPGGVVTITGSGFTPSTFDSYCNNYSTAPCTSAGAVMVNGVANPVGWNSWSDTQITFTVPPNITGTANISVQAFDATSNSVALTIEGAPTITSISPNLGAAGSNVTLNGSGFGSTQSTSTVTLNGAPANIVSWSDTQVVAQVPSGTDSGEMELTVAGIGTPGVDFFITVTRQTTDSLGNSSSYTSENIAGAWYNIQATGSGCSSCTVRGNITNTFDSNGNRLTHTDELGHVTTYTYDANNNVTSVAQQLDSQTTVTTAFTNNSLGEPLTVVDPLGNVTTNTYDGNGNLLSVTSPAPVSGVAASVTQFGYDAKGELTQVTDPLNNVTKLTYNSVGLIATITDAQNNVTSYGYDSHGNRTSITDAANNQTTFTYDAADRLTKITYPDTTFVTFAYDSRGRRTSVTDQNNQTTKYAYDDADRLLSVTDAANHVTQYAYDTENNLTSITDANNNVTSFTYDAFGRVTQTKFPSTLTESYAYDAAGNLTSKTDRNGKSILYVYDALNRLTHKGYPDSTGVDYVYDLAGKIKQVTDPTGTYATAYDNMGRLIGTTTKYSFITGTPTFTNSYAYDAASNRTSLTLPDGSNDAYAYDTLNRLQSITDSVTGQFNFGYDVLSRRTSLTRPNGVNTSYGYDSLSRLLNVLHKSGTNTLDGATYSYDNAGNRLSKANALNGITEQYTYDPLYQLTQVVQGTTTTESYGYDNVGNRLSSLNVPSYSYNPSNELTANSAATFTYDANGNTLTKANTSGTTQYAWDFENRLSSVTLPGSGGTVTFKYDPFGRRVQKAFTQNSTTTTTNYLYDGPNTIQELDGNGNEVARYSQDAGLDNPLAQVRSGTASFYEADSLGSITSLSGTTGTLSNTYTYDTFGNLVASTGSLINSFQYTARDSDPETGLRYYRARYYEPNVGRFISEDPIRFKGGTNFYEYVQNNPISAADPFGLQSTQILPSRPCNSVELWQCSVKCGGFDNVESCEVRRYFGPWKRSPEGFVLWKVLEGATDCKCKGKGQPKGGSPQPQCVKIPQPDPREVHKFIIGVKILGVVGAGAFVASQPELWPGAIAIGGKVLPQLAY